MNILIIKNLDQYKNESPELFFQKIVDFVESHNKKSKTVYPDNDNYLFKVIAIDQSSLEQKIGNYTFELIKDLIEKSNIKIIQMQNGNTGDQVLENILKNKSITKEDEIRQIYTAGLIHNEDLSSVIDLRRSNNEQIKKIENFSYVKGLIESTTELEDSVNYEFQDPSLKSAYRLLSKETILKIEKPFQIKNLISYQEQKNTLNRKNKFQ